MSPFIHTGVDGASSSHQDFLESMKQLKDVSTLISVLWDEQSFFIKKNFNILSDKPKRFLYRRHM